MVVVVAADVTDSEGLIPADADCSSDHGFLVDILLDIGMTLSFIRRFLVDGFSSDSFIRRR